MGRNSTGTGVEGYDGAEVGSSGGVGWCDGGKSGTSSGFEGCYRAKAGTSSGFEAIEGIFIYFWWRGLNTI